MLGAFYLSLLTSQRFNSPSQHYKRISFDSQRGIIGGLLSTSGLPVYSITGDNGTEFTDHKKIADALGIEFYFTHPYSSWEKGTNENTNGLIRQYFPKGTDFGMISESMLKEVEDALNNRPRKTLNYKTPKQIMGVLAK